MEIRTENRGFLPENKGLTSEENPPMAEIISEKPPVSGICNKKKEYKYHRINLVLDEERSKLLRKCCEITGYDPSRIETHDQELIWDILRWIEPALEIRAWVEATFGKVMLTGKK
jgi:hypothetical protein